MKSEAEYRKTEAEWRAWQDRVLALAEELGRRDAEAYHAEHEGRAWPGEDIDQQRVVVERDGRFREVWREIAESAGFERDHASTNWLYNSAWHVYRKAYMI